MLLFLLALLLFFLPLIPYLREVTLNLFDTLFDVTTQKIDSYHLIITLKQLVPLLLERGEPAIVVLESLQLLHLSVLLDVAAGVLPQPVLLFVLVRRGLAERDVHADRGLPRARKHRQVRPLLLIEVLLNCYYHL